MPRFVFGEDDTLTEAVATPSGGGNTGKKKRSRSVGRARKRQLGLLKSQQVDEEDEGVGARPMSNIEKALETHSAYARSATVAWPDCAAWRPKSMFEVYYKLQRIVEQRYGCGRPLV